MLRFRTPFLDTQSYTNSLLTFSLNTNTRMAAVTKTRTSMVMKNTNWNNKKNEQQGKKKTNLLLDLRPTKTQISLRIRAVWLESWLSVCRNFASLAIQNAHTEDSDQTARMRRLIWIFAGCTYQKVRFLMLRLWWQYLTSFDLYLSKMAWSCKLTDSTWPW